MRNKKGFTLIELLAVIVILAIIALIAVPIILNMINNARKSAAKTSSLAFIDTIEYYAGFSEINNTGIAMEKYPEQLPRAYVDSEQDGDELTYVNVTCIFNGTTWQTSKPAGSDYENDEYTCAKFFGTRTDKGVINKSKGKLPTSATIIIDYKGKVQAGSTFDFNGYRCSYDGLDVPNNGCVKN